LFARGGFKFLNTLLITCSPVSFHSLKGFLLNTKPRGIKKALFSRLAHRSAGFLFFIFGQSDFPQGVNG
jgi:hypothetical protein